MYKVLLVDNERIILNGISKMVDWESLCTTLVGTAANGLEALERIEHEAPDIVVSDIRMPGMDGLELVAKAKEEYPHVRFILLSGFNEFEYARKAMQYGVKHYLLKPCAKEAIEDALAEVVSELRRDEDREQFIERIQAELTRVTPHAKEQFLKEFVTNKTYGVREWNLFRGLFRIPLETQPIRLLLMQLDGDIEYEHLFALTNIAEDILGRPPVWLNATIGQRVLLLTEDGDEPTLFRSLQDIRALFRRYYRMDVTIAVSDRGVVAEAKRLYRQTIDCLNRRFYLGEGGLITPADVEAAPDGGDERVEYDEEKIGQLVKSGRVQDVLKELDEWFDSLASMRLNSDVAKAYALAAYIAVARQSRPALLPSYLRRLADASALDTFAALRELVRETAKDVASDHYHATRSQQSSIVRGVCAIIADNLGNPQLSLQWVANEMMYMNADYLGKLFKKETGDKFSTYVWKKRMERALELIRRMDDIRVFELAEALGYGDNPKYFGYAFKKYTGMTPSDWKRTNEPLGFSEQGNG